MRPRAACAAPRASPAGAVVGGIFGAMAVVLLVALFYRWRKRGGGKSVRRHVRFADHTTTNQELGGMPLSLPGIVIQAVPGQVHTSAPPNAAQMCTGCGTALAPGARYCTQCGAPNTATA